MRTLLVVDDDRVVRRVIRGMLEGLGYAIREAADGRQALEEVAARRPDVIILDIVMPELNGLAVLDELRAAGHVESVPIIAITGSITPEAVIREKGARGVLRKPFSRQELRAAVETVVRRGALTRERPDAGFLGRWRTPSVLIVEDDQVIRQMLETILQAEGYETSSVSNGIEALDTMRRHRPSTVILDMMLPIMDGWQFRERQRNDSMLAEVPVVCITGVANPEEVESRLGVPCLRKPLDIPALLGRIENICYPGR
jgi:CheY-like chemotaxis protein